VGAPEHEVITRGSGRRRAERGGGGNGNGDGVGVDVRFLFRFVYPTRLPAEGEVSAPPETKHRRNAHTYARRRIVSICLTQRRRQTDNVVERERDDRPVLCRPCAIL